MKAIILGAGHIGCGLAGQLLRASGYQVVFITHTSVLADHFNRVGCYQVHLVNGSEVRKIIVDGICAVSADDPDRTAAEIAAADLIVTSVGAGNLSAAAELIASGLSLRSRPANILAFENLPLAGARLREHVARHVSQDFPLADYGFSTALVSRAVTQRLGDPALDEPLTFIGDPPDAFVVDRLSLRQPLPSIEGMILSDDFDAWVCRKLYIFSAGHATCAYLGYLKGYHYIHAAILDPEIRAAVLAAMTEGQRGLSACYGAEIAGDESDLEELVARFENSALNDPIARVGRDPWRKLSADDRLIGAAHLAEEAGVHPEHLALAAAAAFYFDDPADPSSADLQYEVKFFGVASALNRICKLDSSQGLGCRVANAWRQFANGWHRGNVLLKLDRMIWACCSQPENSARKTEISPQSNDYQSLFLAKTVY